MKLIVYLLITFAVTIDSFKIVVLPFEVNQINFSNKKYSPTELINLLFQVELYTPIQLGSDNQKYFSTISFEDHHPILSEANCEKINVFQKNKNMVKKGYKVSDSKSSSYLGNISRYLNEIDFVEMYSEEFTHFNTSLIDQYKNNNSDVSELVLLRDNYTKSINPEMCLSLGFLEPYAMSYINPPPPHIVKHLHKKRKINTIDWTLKFTDNNNGLLIIGELPEDYENDTIKYAKTNYTKSSTKNTVTFFRPWAIEMIKIFFYNSTKNEILVNSNSNRFTLVHDFGFIIGSNTYKDLIYENYFEELINKKICSLESSGTTKYNNKDYHIDTDPDGNYSMFVCDETKMNNYIKNFPYLYLKNIDYEYTFELTYKDLFLNIDKYYYFMIIFPNNRKEQKSTVEEWYMGLPFLKKYQFIFNYDDKTIGFYKTKNFEEKEEEDKNAPEKKEEEKGSKVWTYILQIFLVIVLIIIAVFIGMLINRQRKKRANELRDEYEYVQDKIN